MGQDTTDGGAWRRESTGYDPFSDTPPGSQRARNYAPAPAWKMTPLRRVRRDVGKAFWQAMFVPAFAAYLAREATHLGLGELKRRMRGGETRAPEPHPFQRPAAMPPRDDTSVTDIMAAIDSFPLEDRTPGTLRAFASDGLTDGISVLAGSRHQLSGLPHLYPPSFQPRLIDGAGGVNVAALEALHDREGPAIVICHGLFTNKHFDYVRRIALRAFHDWGFHVVVVDLRGHGQSSWTVEAPSSAGYYEGADIVQVARHLKRDPLVTSVGVLGFSLGGCSALNAARHASHTDDDPIDGGVLAVSAPSEMASATRYVATRPSVGHPFFGLWLLYWAGLRVFVRDRRLDPDIRNWVDLVRQDALPWYGIDEVEFYARASAVNWADEITVPTLELHARDDFVVPVSHAEELARRVNGNPNVAVRIFDCGSHCAFEALDRRWYRSVLRRWFEYWAIPAPPVRPVTS